MSNFSLTSPLSILVLNCCLSLFLSIQYVHSQIPTTKTFTFSNSGELLHNAAENGASYREVRCRGYTFSTFRFTLCFYNTTPGIYILVVRGGSPHDNQPNRWVWEANRGRPVGEKSTLTLRRDGNLVLADQNGVIAWKTNTAGKGVAGIKPCCIGNFIK